MLKSFCVSKFRLFSKLEIEKFNLVNLIVGKNNSGKSALLEAIRLYASNAQPEALFEHMIIRQEYWLPRMEPFAGISVASAIRHLFQGHLLPEPESEGIRVGPLSPRSEQLHLTTALYRSEETEEGIISTKVKPSQAKDEVSEIEFVLIRESGNKVVKIYNLNRGPSDIRRFRPTRYLKYDPPLHQVQMVHPTQAADNDRIAALWDATGLTDLKEEVIAGIQLLEPNIKDIAFVETEERGRQIERIPMVKYAGLNEPVPLKSMGDGIFRLFNIVLSLVNARDGILLIDEFDNGLHWSVQPNIWKTVFRLADKLNVQVFASTHSRDCIWGFEKAWRSREELGAFFRLNLGDSGVSMTIYSLETLSDSLDMDVEVR